MASGVFERLKSQQWGPLIKKYGTPFGGLVIFVFFSLYTEYFATMDNIFTMLKQMSMLTILALGFTFVMGAGGFDMSIGFSIGLATVFMSTVLVSTGNLFFALLVALAIGIAVGITNGFLVAYLNLPDFIATFGIGQIAYGIKMMYTKGHPIFLSNVPESFFYIGQGHLGPIPFPIVIMFGLFIVAFLVLNWTRFGQHIYAIGGNPSAALYAGINVKFYRFLTFVISGLAIGITSIVLTSRLGSGQPAAGEAYLLDVISVAFLSTTMFGEGEPNAKGIIIGAFIITIISSGLTMMGVAYYFKWITKGTVVILAITLSALMGQKPNIKIF